MRGYNYAQAGLYFVTMCAHEKKCTFGRIKDGRVEFSPLGRIVRECWVEIPRHSARVQLDAFVVMPNHVHGILVPYRMPQMQRAQPAAPLQPLGGFGAAMRRVSPGSISAFIRSFKSAVSQRAREELGFIGVPIWQRNFYEHVIRNGRDLDEIRRYIWQNPKHWEWDRDNPSSLLRSNIRFVGAQHAAPERRHKCEGNRDF